MASADLAKRALAVDRLLAKEYPDAECALEFRNPFELLVATILSAQCTDERVNQVTPALFRRYPDPCAMAAADPEELEELIRPTGFFRNKAKALLGMSESVCNVHDGRVPQTMAELTELPGVGRKTANVVMSVAWNDLPLEGIAVDTHVGRIARRLGLSRSKDPVVVERDLMTLLPKRSWGEFSLRMILHGRRVCAARKPACSKCVLSPLCPSAGKEPGAT